MKNTTSRLVIGAIVLCLPMRAMPLTISGSPSCHSYGTTCSAMNTNEFNIVNCQSIDTQCYSFTEAEAVNPGVPQYKVFSCNGCKSGYAAVDQTLALSPTCTITYKTCSKSCPGCSNCTSDTSWSAAGTGYQRKANRTCNCGTCNTSYQYRCAAGYYGTTYNGTSGCTRCPNNGNSSAGTTSVTGCCISSGADTTGSYSYSPKCCYS